MKIELNEQDLLKGLAKNDRNAIETIYKEYFKMVQSLVLNNNGNGDDAKDIFQEGMVVLYEKSNSPDFTLHCQLKTYLYSVCRRLWLKRLQQMNRFPNLMESAVDTVSVEYDLDLHDQKSLELENLERSVSSLGEPCKGILEAYYFEKKNMQEIAENFGYTNAENAKNQKYKCLMRLKKIYFAQLKKDHRDE